METHNALCKAIRKAAKVALGKDFSKVQKYTMSGIYRQHQNLMYDLQTLFISCFV